MEFQKEELNNILNIFQQESAEIIASMDDKLLLLERDNNLYITDIIPEGISFISSQRTEIDSALTQKGYDEFIEDLKSKIKNISE